MEKLTKLNNFYEHISQVYPPERVSNSQQYYLTTFLNLWLANISYQISNNNPDYINSLSDLKDSSQEDFLLNWINTIQSPIDFIAHLPKLKYLVRDINIGYFQSLFKEINSADSALASGGSGGIVEIPTGGGKTLLIALTILSMPKFKKIVINTHRITLAKQMIAELKEVFPKHIKIYYCFSSNDSEFLKNNTRYADSEDKSEYSVVVTVTPSLIGLGEEFLNQLDFAFWDESHKYVSSDSFKLTVNQENLAHLCLSATPIPSSIVDLPGSIPVIHGATLIYILPSKIPPEKLIYKYPLIRAIENGNLAPLHWETLQPKDIDYSSFILGSESIDHNTGDYKESVVNEFAEKNQSPILNAIINEINDNQVYFSSSWSMVACQRIKTSIEYAEQVHRETNIPTMVVSSKENIIYFQGKAIETSFHKVLRFHQSMPSIIFQVDTLSEGYDDTRLKNLFLSLVTSKPDKFIQLIGRVLRINPNDPTKIAKVYSFGNPELLYGSLTVPTSLGIPNYIEGEINTSGVKFKETKIPNSSSTKRSETGRKEIDPDLDRVFYQKFVRIEGKLLELDSILKQLNISDNELIKKAEAIIKAEMQKNGLEKKVYVIEKGGFILYNPVVIFLLKKDILDHYSTKILSLPMYQNKITDSRLASELKIKVSALKKVLKLCFASSSLVCKDENLDVVLISKNLIPEITKIIQQLKQNNYYKYIELRSFFTKNPKYYEEISTEIIASLNKGVIPAEFTGDLEINVFETFFALTFKKNSLKSIIPRQYVQLITDWAESLYSKYSQDALVITHKDPRVKNINFKILGAICQELNIEYITATNKAKTLPLTISIDGQEHSVLKLIQEMLKELTSVPTGIVSTYRFFKPVPKNIITAYVNEHKCKKYIFQSDYYGAYISYGVPEDAFDEYLEKIEIAETMASNIDSQSDYFHPSLLFRKANEIYKKYDESNSLTSFIASFKEAFNNNPQYFQELNLGYYNNNTSEICLTRSYFDLLFEQMEFWQNKKYIFYQFQNYLSSKFSESKFTQCNLSDISLYLIPAEFLKIKKEFDIYYKTNILTPEDILDSHFITNLPIFLSNRLSKKTTNKIKFDLSKGEYSFIRVYDSNEFNLIREEFNRFNANYELFSKVISTDDLSILKSKNITSHYLTKKFLENYNIVLENNGDLFVNILHKDLDCYIRRENISDFVEFINEELNKIELNSLVYSDVKTFNNALKVNLRISSLNNLNKILRLFDIDLTQISNYNEVTLLQVINNIRNKAIELRKANISIEEVLKLNKNTKTKNILSQSILDFKRGRNYAINPVYPNNNFELQEAIHRRDLPLFEEFVNNLLNETQSANETAKQSIEIKRQELQRFNEFIVKLSRDEKYKNLPFVSLIQRNSNKTYCNADLFSAFTKSSNLNQRNSELDKLMS